MAEMSPKEIRHEDRPAATQLHVAGGPAQIPGKLADIARVVEDAGFASLWVMDHFFQISMIGPPMRTT